MLQLLEVKNLALIDNAGFCPGAGLNVITGETGAGKSILLAAVSLLLGERAHPDIIRDGEDCAVMQAVFTLSEALAGEYAELAQDGELVFSREVRKSGPNVCRVNGRIQPLSLLGALGRRLIDLHGQNQQQSLLDTATQRDLLDAYGGEKTSALLAETRRLHARAAELKQLLAGLGGDDAAQERHADFLRFQLDEIETAGLSEAEETELEKKFRRLSNIRQLAERSAKVYTELYEGGYDGSIVDRLGTVEKELASAAALDDTLAGILDQIAAASGQLTEAARELRCYHDGIQLDEAEIHEVAARLEIYRKMKKKYGPSVSDVLKTAEGLRLELGKIASRGEQAAAAAQSLAETIALLEETAAALSARRRDTALVLEEKINSVLRELALQDACFSVSLTDTGQSGPSGRDRVEFLFSANAGEPLRPLAKAASGGEVSRVMLGIKTVLAAEDGVPTLIFDEVDAGVGGLTVRVVADKLRHLARHRQIICVTHQPLIAAAADCHFVIFKEKQEGRTVTRLRQLKDEEREAELTRMLGGGEDEGKVREHAAQLLKSYRKKL